MQLNAHNTIKTVASSLGSGAETFLDDDIAVLGLNPPEQAPVGARVAPVRHEYLPLDGQI